MKRVRNNWKLAAVEAKERNEDAPHQTIRFCQRLAQDYVRSVTGDFVNADLPLERWETTWIDEYKPRLSLTFEIAAAFINYTYHNKQLPPDILLELDSKSDEEAMKAYLKAVGKGFADQVLNYIKVADEAAIASIKETYGKFNDPTPLKFLLIAPALLLLPFMFSFVLGMGPGALLGLIGWHKILAIVLGIMWAGGYIVQRSAKYKDVDFVTLLIGVNGGVGFGVAIWLFGTFTD